MNYKKLKKILKLCVKMDKKLRYLNKFYQHKKQ